MINQLRLYEIYEPTRAEFLDRFRDHAQRIMERHGFVILAIWTTTHEGSLAFAYLLSWPSEEAMKAGWDAFMADDEWKDVKAARAADAGPIVGRITDLPLTAVDFSQPLGRP